MQNVTVPYVVYEMTHSTTWLGLAAFMSFFPALVIGPISGTLADRFSRKAILLITQTIQMAVAFAFWGFWVAGELSPGNSLALLLVYGVSAGINITSWQAFVPLLVPRDDLLDAVRLNSMQFTGARAFGPAIGGVVLAQWGPATAFMGNALSFLLVLAALAVVHERRVDTSGAAGRTVQQFREGLAYVRSTTALWLPVVTMLMVSLLGSSLIQLAPAYATDQFHVGRAAYGFLVGMFGAGATLLILPTALRQ